MDPKSEIIKTWVDLYTEGLYRWALQRVRQHETAEDLVQEVFHAAVVNFEKFEYRSNPKTWLYAILHHKVGDYFRKVFYQKTDPVAPEEMPFFTGHGHWEEGNEPSLWPASGAALSGDESFRIVVDECMGKLPAQWFSAIQCKYFEEKDSKVICQELGVSPTNYWQIIYRAKLQLRKCIEEHWLNR